jgi:ubiquinone biosynthesis protein
MLEQVGPAKLWAQLKAEAPLYAKLLPALPRVLHHFLSQPHSGKQRDLEQLIAEQRRTNRLLQAIVYGGLGFFLGMVAMEWLSAMPGG